MNSLEPKYLSFTNIECKDKRLKYLWRFCSQGNAPILYCLSSHSSLLVYLHVIVEWSYNPHIWGILVYLFKTQNNYFSVTKGILEPNLCTYWIFTIFICNVATWMLQVVVSVFLRHWIFLASYNFSSVIISVCGLYFCLAESLILVLDFCILFSPLK